MASRGYYAPQQRESLSKHSDVLGPKAFFPQRGGMLPTCVAAATILLLIAGSSVTLVSATDSAKQKMATKSNPAAALGNNNVHHHDYEETAKLKTCRKSKVSSGPSITTTRRRADENCAVCDAFAEELERAIRYATSTDPLAMQSYLVRLLQRYVKFWHPHYFLRRIVKAVYFILSGAPNEALRTVRESAELIEFDLHLSFGQGIRSNEENDFASNLGVEHEVPRGVIERAKGFLYQNEGSLTSTGVAFAKWDAGVAFTVDEVLADEERGNGFPWVIAREGSSGGGGGAKKMAGGRSRNKYLGVVDHQVYDPTHFSGGAAGRQVIPLGAAAFTALALQEESSRDLEKDLLPGNKKRDTKENNNKKHATTAQSVVDDDDHVIITGDDEDGKGDRPHDGNEDIYEDEDNDADVYAFHFAEVQPELCIAYNNTASYYTFEEGEGEGEKADEGERKGNDKGALVLVERSFLSALDPSLGVVDGLDTDTSAPAVDSSSFSSSSTTEKKAAMAMRRDMNFGYAGRRLPPPLLPLTAAAAPTYRHHQTATTEIKERGKRGGRSGEEGRALTHVDPLVASSLAEMYPLGFVWVVENSDAHGVPINSKDIVGEGFVDDWGDLQDEKAPQSSFVRSFFNKVFSWIFSPSTIFGSHNNDLTNKNDQPFVALLKSPPSRDQLGRCFVPIPTKKGMSRALALLKKAESERGIKRNGDQSSSSSPSSPSQIPSQHQQQHTLFSSVPDDVSSLALAIASVSRSVTFEYVDAARHLLAVTSPSSSSVSLSLPPSLEEYSPLALITIASNLSPSYLDEKESKKEDYAESQPNSPRPSDVLFAHQRKSSARQLQAVAMTIAAAQRPQRLALSTALTSPTALILALEQIAKADALVATSRELISVNLQQGAASVALGASEGSQGSHRGGEEKREDSSGKNTLFTDEAMESRGLVSWMMSLASSIVSPPTPPSLIGVFSSRASEASLALVLALPREVFAMSMCPSKKSQLFYSATSTHQQRDQQKASSSASVTVTAENSAAVATARTRASSVADSLVVRPSDVAFFTHASIPHSSDSEHHESKWIEPAKVTINEEGQGEHGQPSLPTRGGADDVLDTKKKQQRYSPCAFTDAGVGVSADDIAFSYWFTTIAAKAEKAATATEGSQDGLLATSTHINRALVVDSRVAASAPLSRSSEDGSKKGAAGSFALWKGRHINDGLQKKMHEVAAALVCAGTCARSSCQASSALEAHFKAFFEVYFGHSVALFNELAEGAADHYLQAGQVSQAPGFVEANTIKHQDDGDTKGKTENSDESGAAKKKSENHPPRKAVRRAILRAAVKKMKKKSGREVQKTYQKKKGCGKKQGDLHAEL